VNGLNYVFANAVTHAASSGVYFKENIGTHEVSYDTGVALVAIVSGTEPGRVVNVPGSPVNGWTYQQVALSVVNFLAWAQKSAGIDTGGWPYDPINVPAGSADNSISGHVVMGLLFAEAPLVSPPLIGGFGLTIPAAVKNLLNTWIGYIQNTSGGTDDGGSGYTTATYWVNILKTGHLLQQMAFVGDTSSTPRVQRAIAYLVRHWNDLNQDPGWKGLPPFPSPGPSSYQATLMVMKGLVALGIDTIGGINWYDEFADAIVAQQLGAGSWPASVWSDSGGIRSTTWALLTLEKAVPPAPPAAVGGTVMPPSSMEGVLAMLPWILLALAAVGAGAYAIRKRYASPLLAIR